jgi:phosphopantetheinyl transferase (holo-ACP synthase)
MPLRPFPLPYRIGTDICHVPRIRRTLLKPHKGDAAQKPAVPFRLNDEEYLFNHGFLRRLLTKLELSRLLTEVLPNTASIDHAARHLAGR